MQAVVANSAAETSIRVRGKPSSKNALETARAVNASNKSVDFFIIILYNGMVEGDCSPSRWITASFCAC